MDPRIKKVAEILVDYSTSVKKGEYVQILTDPAARELAVEVYKQVILKGAYPKIHISFPGTSYLYYKHASEEQLAHFPDVAMDELKKTRAFIYIGAPENSRELTNIDPKRISLRQKTMQPYQAYRVKNTKWVIFYYPTPSMAQDAGMSTEEFEDFVYKASIQDWKAESRRQEKLKAVIDKGKAVRIVGKDTDITFSIEGRKGLKCDGKYNMPDGEVFTGPVEDSTNGRIAFSFPSIYAGQEVDGIKLEFKDGKVVKASATKNEALLQQLLKTDDGSMILGEFGIGVNNFIQKHVKNILFDEKIGGTIHLALGSGYPESGSKNNSGIHWDIVKDLRPGGAVYVDGKIIQKDGKFIGLGL